jgi:hypothetical protein
MEPLSPKERGGVNVFVFVKVIKGLDKEILVGDFWGKYFYLNKNILFY